MQLVFEDKQKRTIRGQEEARFSSFSSFHLIAVTARAKSAGQIFTGETDDEDLTLKIDNKVFPQLSNPKRLIDSPAAFSGGQLHNLAKTVYFLTFLKGKNHTIILKTDEPHNTATFESLEIYTLSLEKTFTLNIENQAEDGDRRPWITFVLEDLPLLSITPTITYSRRKRDSDDVKIIIDGKTQGNILRTIKHLLWRYVGSRLPWLSPDKTETETFTVEFTQGLHYLEFWVDRIPTLHKLTINFGVRPSVPPGIPTVDNPKWTEDFYDDTEIILLARAIYGEVGGASWEAKVAVGWAIRNRVEDPANRWGRTYYDVILARNQYESFWDERTYDKVRNPPINDSREAISWKESYNAAESVIYGEVTDPTNGANHFYATTIPKPVWADDNKFTVQIGITRFYRL